ncbi:Vacuolar protein sorting-associated protein 11 -like protein [Sarcoptes scabiei]|uniref:Vacuolar protein sorting-associated protein 11 homolog n=1 Tax=Sarcoptes scabiei TaxID=52283 RepID=A0A834RDJ7_SARSC|nr:Vacuolar protein sorting-associated protein 11 -like protein [Sarcoptes scabiei]
MAFLQWRRFNFFQKDLLNNTNDMLTDLIKSCQISCSSSGNGFIVLGDSTGSISLVSRNHSVVSFTAYQIAVTHCCKMNCQQSMTTMKTLNNKQNIINKLNFHLVTIGADTEDLVPILKIWAINESVFENQLSDPNVTLSRSLDDSIVGVNNFSNNSISISECIRTIKLCDSASSQLSALAKHSLVTALDVLADSMIAVGFNDGHCLIIKGQLIRDKNLRLKLFQISRSDSITNVRFALNTRQIGKSSSKSFRPMSLSSKDAIVKQSTTLFVTTRHEICSFNLTNREQDVDKLLLDSFGCEIGASCLKSDPKQTDSLQFIVGRKDAIYFYSIDGRGPCLAYDGHKLFLSWFRNYLVVVTTENTGRSVENFKETSDTLVMNQNHITIYDIEKKFIAYSCPVPTVNQIVSEWGLIYLISNDGRVLVFRECDIQTKLELLFKKNQFSMAIEIAKNQTYSQDVLADMFKQYGDHLYSNGDFDEAINQYCQTLGFLEPSYVIRKFLDLQRIHNLTTYLQEIHKRNLATEDHTTLLINCYVKLKNEEKLNEFLRSSEIVFDVDIAIRVLRQSGYFENASMLAKKHLRYDNYFSILIEDQGDAKTVLQTFEEMFNENKYEIVGQYLCKYGRLLMNDDPETTTKLLKQLCLACMLKASDETSDLNRNSDDLDIGNDSNTFVGGNPEMYLHIFLNNHSKMIEFLEFLIKEWKRFEKFEPEVPMEISNTLLELYMHSYKTDTKNQLRSEIKILNLLKNPEFIYDANKAMILFQMNDFIPGILFLYEKMKTYSQILSHFIGQIDDQNVIRTCERFGEEQPKLWIDALEYFSENFDETKKANIMFIIEKIEQHRLLTPLMMIEILSKPGKVTLGVVRENLKRWIKTQQDQINENERLIDFYRDECRFNNRLIDEIRNKPKVFQATKCTACLHVLELPSIHFMCNHSYHMTCFESYMNENDQKCPFCLPENRKIMNEVSSLENVSNIEEQFQKDLAESSDLFEVIAKYCGHGLFNPLTIFTDDDGILQSAKFSSK